MSDNWFPICLLFLRSFVMHKKSCVSAPSMLSGRFSAGYHSPVLMFFIIPQFFLFLYNFSGILCSHCSFATSPLRNIQDAISTVMGTERTIPKLPERPFMMAMPMLLELITYRGDRS